MNYILEHWKGQQTLKQSFWINFVLGLLIVYSVGYLLQLTFKSKANLFIPIMVVYFVLFHILLFIWQAAGTLRACDKNISQYIATGWTRAAQFGVVVGFAAVLIWGVTLGQSLQRLKLEQQESFIKENSTPIYELQFAENKLTITGLLDQGITREVKQLFAQNSNIGTVVLNSKGGNIYEARGLAKLFQNNGISTHVDSDCYSACTTAYVAGTNRTAGQQAKFGFHQYKIDTNKLLHSSVNTEQEQNKDIQYFLNQGVNEVFINKAFSTPFERMWFPDHQELIDAEIIHKVI